MADTIYTLDENEMMGIAKHLKALDKIHEKNTSGNVLLNLPDEVELRDTDYRLIGYAVFIDGYWAFRAITEEERKKKE